MEVSPAINVANRNRFTPEGYPIEKYREYELSFMELGVYGIKLKSQRS